MKFLSLDSPFMQGLNKVADVMILNLLTLLCSIPLFTIGAAMTALHYQTLKIVRDEECYVAKGYFKSFKENFKQATAIWLIFMVVFGIIGGDIIIILFTETQIPQVVQIVIFIIGLLALFALTFVFPLQAKFVNTVKMTIRNALIISIAQFPKTILIVAANIVPLLVTIYVPALFPFVFMFGISAPAILASSLYNKFFQKMEDKVTGAGEEGENEAVQEEADERIFHDQLDAALQEKKYE